MFVPTNVTLFSFGPSSALMVILNVCVSSPSGNRYIFPDPNKACHGVVTGGPTSLAVMIMSLERTFIGGAHSSVEKHNKKN